MKYYYVKYTKLTNQGMSFGAAVYKIDVEFRLILLLQAVREQLKYHDIMLDFWQEVTEQDFKDWKEEYE